MRTGQVKRHEQENVSQPSPPAFEFLALAFLVSPLLPKLTPELVEKLEFPGFCRPLRAYGLQPLTDTPFVVDGRLISEAEWRRPGLYPSLDELEDGHSGLGLGVERASVKPAV